MKYQFFNDPPERQLARQKRCENLNHLKNMSADYHHFGFDYFDNRDIPVGYQGYEYDGRYADVAKRMCERYSLKKGDRVLEVGCAKGFLLVEFFKLGMDVVGVDISDYAVKNSHELIRGKILCADASSLPFDTQSFDLVITKDFLPHVPKEKLDQTINECIRVSKKSLFFEIQCGSSEKELEALRRWDGTHKIMQTPQWWEKTLNRLEYPGEAYFKILVPDHVEVPQ